MIIQVFSLVYPEEGSIAETSVKILIITASVLQLLKLTLSTTLRRFFNLDYPGMELNFMLMIHMPWLYQERVPTSNKEKKKDKNK